MQLENVCSMHFEETGDYSLDGFKLIQTVLWKLSFFNDNIFTFCISSWSPGKFFRWNSEVSSRKNRRFFWKKVTYEIRVIGKFSWKDYGVGTFEVGSILFKLELTEWSWKALSLHFFVLSFLLKLSNLNWPSQIQ